MEGYTKGKRFILGTIGLLLLASQTCGECNVCSVSCGLACVSGTQYQVCVDGTPTGTVNDCPDGTVCSSAEGSICQTPGSGVVQACQECNKCDATNTFACTSPTTYVLCLGTASPSQLAGSCEPNHVCNINNEFICGDEASGTVATCSYYDESPVTTTTITTTTTTAAPSTPAPGDDPTGYCQAIKQNGRFPVGTDAATTCKYYVYCFVNNGIWGGQMYECPGSTYFDSSTRLCSSTLPTSCSSTVQNFIVLGS